MNTPENTDLLIKWLKSNYNTEVHEAPEHFIVLVYTQTTHRIDEMLPEEFYNANIQYHYPEIILFGGGSYIPGISKYNPLIEFVTLKIGK